MTKPFRPEAYVATFSDTALRAALGELRLRERHPERGGGVKWKTLVTTALHATLVKCLRLEPETLALLVPALIRAEVARRWAQDYDRAVKARLRESKKKSKRRQLKPRKHR